VRADTSAGRTNKSSELNCVFIQDNFSLLALSFLIGGEGGNNARMDEVTLSIAGKAKLRQVVGRHSFDTDEGMAQPLNAPPNVN
jgi:hypothetical protein